MPSHCLDHNLCLADSRSQLKHDVGVTQAQLAKQLGNILIEMTALGNEERHNQQVGKTFGQQSLRTLNEAGFNEFEKSQFDSGGGPARP